MTISLCHFSTFACTRRRKERRRKERRRRRKEGRRRRRRRDPPYSVFAAITHAIVTANIVTCPFPEPVWLNMYLA